MKPTEPTVTDCAIRATGIVRHIGEGDARRCLLDNVTVELYRGQAVALLGPSGAGKTSLLNVLAGLDVPDAGRLQVGDQVIEAGDKSGLDAYRRVSVGVVFQFYNLISSLTALENVLAGAEAAGLPADPDHARQQLDELGLRGRADAYPGQLSGGEQQRVAIARALIKRPAVLLGDEPTGNLDAATGDRVIEQLVELTRTRGTALLVVTHNEKLAARFDRVLHMVDGRLTQGAAS
ncbi:ABC transporter ATP-binding protein [Denitromonas iodatirespirans]|uniref:ABC transporter ATP-binding protein n=1 Tax=Denitromonas iodatirespirans TaxID=2795389 RepID=A0A944HC71_DENI1|nr:ABC transporter ATP-binding protein [Denitromonas iodatirespirans]MBT0962407.1 ABC transporter ATP-binding protein [Denitromonas iodatirespirans]